MARRGMFSLLLLALLVLSVVAPVRANTFRLDGLDGPCCRVAPLQLPQFPVITLRSKYICWDNCQPQLSGAVLAKFQPVNVACGIYINRVTVTNLSGALTAWTGSLVMTYSRTWAESSVPGAGPDIQVYRFILNGDIIPSSTLVGLFGGNTCVVAPCHAAFGRYHVQGYIDYALDCNTGNFSIAYAFDHDCDAFEHGNPFTVRPGAFHPNRSYTWVGPEAGFVCDPNLTTAQGNTTCEAFRNYDFGQPLNMICQTEQPISQGNIVNVGEFCPCAAGIPGSLQYKTQDFGGATLCGSSAGTVGVPPWPALTGKSIGFWTDPMVYPGPETLHIERGHFTYTDGCAAGQQSRPYFIGVQTQRGFPTHKIVPPAAGGPPVLIPVSDRLIDLGNATFLNMNSAPLIGTRSISDKMIYLNVD